MPVLQFSSSWSGFLLGCGGLWELQLNSKFVTQCCRVRSQPCYMHVENMHTSIDGALQEFGTALKLKFARTLQVVDLSVYKGRPLYSSSRQPTVHVEPELQHSAIQKWTY